MHKFYYNAVGQGLFFNATFQLNDRKLYNFVYDCGTDKSQQYLLNREINNFVSRTSHIDLLTVSHFDFDHVSGMKELLNKCPVEHVILPYLFNDEILMYLLSRYNQIPENEDWYYDFLINPFDFFIQFPSIKNITLVTNSKVGYGKNIWFQRIGTINFPITIEKDDRKLMIKLLSDEEDYPVDNFLNFKFYNYPITLQKRKSFDRKVLQYCRDNGIENNMSLITFVLESLERRKEFKEHYEYLTKNHNNVSLLVSYDYRMDGCYNGKIYSECIYCEGKFNESLSNLDEITHILTGDVSINYKRKHKQIYEHFDEQFSKLNFVQVPHHGSICNWNDDILNQVQNHTCFIISNGNLHKHPHSEVTDSIEENYQLFESNKTLRIISCSY